MGVAGLWNILRPASKTRSLTELSVTEGFEANPANLRGYRIGIDASIWFFHAEYGREGENPVLRTLFFRCATLMHSPFLPLFVFDGPLRPDFKRGKKINKTSSKLIPGMKAIVEAFGFEWRTAPGEAEAELAYLNRIHVIDGILSDDVDNFLFGATTVIRNPSNNLSGNKANPVLNAAGKDDKNHTKVYRLADITTHPEVRLTRGGMILIGLMKGGDYHPGGLARCGPVIAHGLAKCGFGDTLFEAAKNLNREELIAFFVPWRHELRQEISTNSQGHIGKKYPALARTIPDSFPDIDVLLSYVNPITSETMGKGDYYDTLTWGKEPDLGKLAANCELSFEWGYKEAIIKRFRTVIWHSAVLRILRRAVLNMDAKAGYPQTSLTAPCKKGAAGLEPVGTPSKMIAKHFSSLTLGTLYGHPSDCEDGEDERLIIKIHSSRNHVSTDGILEYRLEIAPAQLVRITESGIKGLRTPEGPDEWVDDLDDDDEEGGKKGMKKPPPSPESHMRVWMPACMVRLVEPGLVAEYEAIQAKKLERKSAKGRPKFGGKTQVQATAIPEPSLESPTSEGDFPIIKPKPARKATPKAQAKSDPKAVTFSQTLSSNSIFIQDSKPDRVIRDLTKKTVKPKNIPNTQADLKSFFPSAKSSRTATAKVIIDVPVKHVSSPTSKILPLKLSQNMSLAKDSPQTNLKCTQYSSHHIKGNWNTRTVYGSSSNVSFGGDDDPSSADDLFCDISSPQVAPLIEQSGKKSLPSSNSDCFMSLKKKSPLRTPCHTLPRSHRKPSGPGDLNKNGLSLIRSCSPSPLHSPIRTQITAISLHPSTRPLRIIEISSDSEDDIPPAQTVFPLAAARARANAKAESEPFRHRLTIQNKNLQKSSKINVIPDIIDLT